VVRNAVDRIVWVGKEAVFLVGFAVVFAVANALLGAGGGSPLSEESYRADPITRLTANGEAGLGLDAEPVARRRQIECTRGYAQVNVTSLTVTLAGSKGINGVQRSAMDNSVYCFDLTFAPRVAVASANINNNATVGTVLGNGVPSDCSAGFKDAVAKTYAANTSAPSSEINFGIVFI
jgi:hypothetical protein